MTNRHNKLTLKTAAKTVWHSLPKHEVLEALASKEEGLTEEEAAERKEIFGPNKLPEKKRAGLHVVFLRQFKNPLIYILLVAGTVSFAIGKWSDGSFIVAVLLINSVIGTIQEWKAETSAEALKSVMRISADVRRDGARKEVASSDLVPGDVVFLESGDSIPADIRLLSARDLRADESLLTGESTPVDKDADADIAEDASVGDRINLLHAGTSVLSSRARGVVCRTGAITEVGRIAESLTEEAAPPPLVVRLERFTRMIAIVVLAAVVLLAIGQFARGEAFADIFVLAIALAVSAIPAGLPVAITVALAIATHRMARRNVIVRLLPAVEGLGACTLVASDKTGTLTANKLTVKRVLLPEDKAVDIGGEGYELEADITQEGRALDDEMTERVRRVALAGALCNEGRFRIQDGEVDVGGDTVDIALLVFAKKLGLNQDKIVDDHPQVEIIPFESERKFAASFNRHDDKIIAHVKGATETILAMCGDVDEDAVEQQHDALAEDGYRVIALAQGEVSEEHAEKGDEEALKGLDFLGLIGLIDPVRAEVPEAIERCNSAGVEVRMITGDHPVTGLAIARDLKIARKKNHVVTGGRLSDVEEDEEKLTEAIAKARVFARVEPAQKTTIVSALQKAGHFVAVTGDGVNDAPALRSAHIGVAMGEGGTDVARGAADLILTDDNFASIVNGIEEGRVAYDNVRKVIWLLISTGAAEIVLFFLAFATGLPLPLDAVQLLWLNLVTNGIQDVALAFEKGEPGVLDRPPRPPDQPIFDRLMIEETVLTGAYMGTIAYVVFAWLLTNPGWTEFEARNALLLLMVLFENVHIFNCRSERRSAFRIPFAANPLLILSVVAAQSVHIAAMYIPGLNTVLEIEPISLEIWFILLPIALTLLLVAELYKWLRLPQLAPGRTTRTAEA